MSSPQRIPRFRYDGTVTAEQRAFYEQYGFVIYRGVFDAQDVEVIQRDAERLERDTLDGKVPAEHRDQVIKPSYDENGRATLHRLPYFTLHCADTRELIERRKLDALGPGLLGSPTWRFEDAVDGAVWQMKRGKRSSYSALDWHLDFPHDLPLTPLVNVGIYLDDATVRNGCLILVPGSHRYPPRRLETLGLPLEAEAGDVICHTYNILHHSGPVLDDTSRATLYVYYSAGQKPSAGTAYSHRAGEDFAKMITGAEADAR
ncbi:phytanoyl-CoA dioxygenase family protein [Streptomyces sp. NBC_00328]|uniref:phytanoyl-CoA dioxygenase family protein n=1 Tax=Streptomyces sp. NBC_00328 TaxID=2903646 RepID=UPI002E2C2AD2|nr:phytanoyl-CoA dioxygenase family protein [Streptomyces sp. NBC_00328]